jgi:transcriptional regulator with XRE-family HTH domain
MVMVVNELRIARLQKGLTLDDVYVASGRSLSPSRLSRIERGILAPNEDEAKLLARLLGVSSDIVTSALLGRRLACREA